MTGLLLNGLLGKIINTGIEKKYRVPFKKSEMLFFWSITIQYHHQKSPCVVNKNKQTFS